MNLNRWAGLLVSVLAALPSLAFAASAPLYQDGSSLVAGDAIKFASQGRVTKAGGQTGDTLGLGLNPFSITDSSGCGLWLNSAVTTGQYSQLCLGHDSSGNGLIALDSYGGLASKSLIFRVNGVNLPVPGSVAGLPIVADNSAMSALASTYASGVVRLAPAAGGVGPPVVYIPSASACSLNSGSGDGGSQIPTSDNKCWLAQLGPGPVPVTVWNGADPTNTNDSTTALQYAINWSSTNAKPVTLGGASYTYKITTALTCPGGNLTVLGPGKLYLPSASFTNANPAAPYGSNAVGILCQSVTASPLENVTILGLRIEYQQTNGRIVNGIVARNIKNLNIAHNEISNFGMGAGIKVASITGNSSIDNNYVHDFTDNTGSGLAYTPQITAIEVDNDRVDAAGSDGLRIIHNRIERIRGGAAFRAAYGSQEDGINVIGTHSAGTVARRLVIMGNDISDTGEGIDHQGDYSVISGNTIATCTVAGIKLIHGARHNTIDANTVRDSGIWGIGIFDGAIRGQTQYNNVMNNIIKGIDPDNLNAAFDPAAVQINGEDGIFTGNLIYAGPNGKYGLRSDGGGLRNFAKDNRAVGYTVSEYILTNVVGNRFVPMVPTRARMTRATSGQTVSASSTAVVQYNAVTYDDRGEADATTLHGITLQNPGLLRVQAQVRVQAPASSGTYGLQVFVGASLAAEAGMTFAGTEGTIAIETTILVTGNNNPVTIKFVNGLASAVTLTANPTLTYVELEAR